MSEATLQSYYEDNSRRYLQDEQREAAEKAQALTSAKICDRDQKREIAAAIGKMLGYL